MTLATRDRSARPSPYRPYRVCHHCNRIRETHHFPPDRDGRVIRWCFDCIRRAPEVPSMEELTQGKRYFVTCKKCQETKPASAFYRLGGVSPGLTTWCRACLDAVTIEDLEPNEGGTPEVSDEEKAEIQVRASQERCEAAIVGSYSRLAERWERLWMAPLHAPQPGPLDLPAIEAQRRRELIREWLEEWRRAKRWRRRRGRWTVEQYQDAQRAFVSR